MNDALSQNDARRLLDSAEYLPESDAKVELLERAIRLADAENDLETSLDARLELVRVSSGRHTNRRVVAFLWCLGLHDKEPERFDVYPRRLLLLWWFKSLGSAMTQFPRVSLAEIEQAHQQMERLYDQHGHSPRPIWASRLDVACDLGDREQLGRWFPRWKESSTTEMNDCPACDKGREVRCLMSLGDTRQALDEAEPLLTGRLSCSNEKTVQSTIEDTLHAMVQLGRQEDAEKWNERGYRMLRLPKANLYEAAVHLAYLMHRDDRSRGLRLMERFLDQTLDPPSPSQQLRFFLASRTLMRRLSSTGRRRKMRLPRSFPLYEESGLYQPSNLADWFDERSRDLCEQFDRRNGSDYVSRELPKHYEY